MCIGGADNNRREEAGGMQIVGRVPGTAKLLKKEGQEDKALPREKGSPSEIMSTLEFEPPCFVRWSRLDSQGTCSFISCFYAVPSGSTPLTSPPR